MRWFAFAFLLTGFVLVGSAPLSSASAAEATPVADDQPLLVGLDGLEDSAIRAMQIEVFKQSGPIVLTFEVLRFQDADAAEDSLPELVRRVVARFDADRNGADPYEPASEAPELGDDSIVYVGEQRFDEPVSNIDASPIALVFVRTGAYVHIAIGVALRGDPTPDLVDILTITTNRNEGGRATPANASGHRTGGLWDLLPGLDDVPSGFAITDEIVPEPFAPLPDATKDAR
jgi:hypothetical protein